MTESLLMISKNKLRGGIRLEGILGLGLPHNENSISDEKGFLDHAKVDRFSMCFNSGADGVLQLGSRSYVKMDKPLGGVGVSHWSVGFPGVGIGSAAPASMFNFNNSAVVDSGTTLILGPQDKIIELFSRICDGWQRCRESSSLRESDAEGEELVKAKANALLIEMLDCKVTGMPALHFHVSDKSGASDVLELAPDDWMLQTSLHLKVAKILKNPKGASYGCKPAFDLRHHSSASGAQFILGSPFFYKFKVAYDRAASPPAISFNRASCGSCTGAAASSFLAGRSGVFRHLDTEPREGLFDE